MNRPNPKIITRRSRLVGPNGKPLDYFLTPSPRWNLKQYKPRYYLSNDTKVNINPYDRWEAVNYSRQLFAQIPEVGGAIRQKNHYAFGDSWDAHYCGRCGDQVWIDEAEEFLNLVFFPNANLRGGPFADFNHSLKLSGYAMDFDGDDLMLLTEDEQHFPRVAFISAPRISNAQSMFGYQGVTVKERFPTATDGTVTGGPFDGARIFDGIIMDRDMRILGVRVSGEAGDFTDVSIFNSDLRCDTEWHDQGRGLPLLARPMLRWMNYQDTIEFFDRAIKRIAAQNITAKSKSGDAIETALNPMEEVDDIPNASADSMVAGAPAGTQAGTHKVYQEVLEGGEMIYLSTENGEEIKGIEYQNPHPNTAEFIQECVRGGLLAIGWFLELVNLGDTGRASSRLLCRLGNQSIWSRRMTLYPRWKRAVSYAVAKAMEERLISRNEVDPFSFEPGFPEDLSVDQGNDEQADRENLKMGTTSKHIVAQKKGLHWKQIDRHRDEELRAQVDRADNLVKYAKQKGRDISFEQAMELTEQRAPNPTAQFIDSPENESTPAQAAAPAPARK